MQDALPPAELLAYGARAGVNPPAFVDQQVFTNARQLRQLRDQQVPGRDALRQRVAQPEAAEYSSLQGEQFKAQFGAGAAEVNAQNRQARLQNATPEQNAVFNEAVRIINTNQAVLAYLEFLSANPNNPDQAFQAVMANRPDLQNYPLYGNLRTTALNAIVNDPTFQNLFPEFQAANINQVAVSRWVEETLSRDPRLRGKISHRMAEINEKLLRLTAVEEDPRFAEAQRKEREAIDQYDEHVGNIVRVLNNNRAIANLDANTISQIISTSPDANVARDRIIMQILGINDPQVMTNIKNLRINLPARINQIEQTLQQLHLQYAQSNDPAGYNQDPRVIRLSRELINANNEQNNLNTALALHGPLFTANTAYGNIVEPLLNEGVTAQNTQGVFENLLIQAKTQQNEAVRQRRQANALEATGPSREQLQKRQERLIAERRLIGELETVIGNSIVDVLEDRTTEASALEQQRQTDAENAAKEAGEARTQAVLATLHAEMNSWVVDDEGNRSRVINADNLGRDMRGMLYDENYIRRRVLFAMFQNAPITVTRVDAQGNRAQVPVNFNNINFGTDTLSAEDQAVFDKVYTQEEGKYRDKLMKDFFTARRMSKGIIGRILGRYTINGNPGELNLRNNEWQLMQERFGGQIDAAINSSKPAQDALKKLEAEGIKPSFKLKWLLWVLIILLGLTGVGAVTAFAG